MKQILLSIVALALIISNNESVTPKYGKTDSFNVTVVVVD